MKKELKIRNYGDPVKVRLKDGTFINGEITDVLMSSVKCCGYYSIEQVPVVFTNLPMDKVHWSDVLDRE